MNGMEIIFILQYFKAKTSAGRNIRDLPEFCSLFLFFLSAMNKITIIIAKDFLKTKKMYPM